MLFYYSIQLELHNFIEISFNFLKRMHFLQKEHILDAKPICISKIAIYYFLQNSFILFSQLFVAKKH